MIGHLQHKIDPSCLYIVGRRRHGRRVGIHVLGIIIIFTFLLCSVFNVLWCKVP